jgi:haloalkane dehalogenase
MASATAERAPRASLPAREPSFVREYPFAPRFLDVDGGAMHYVDEGPRDAPPLLLLHGNPTWSFYYRRIVRAFCRDHRAIAPDHIGCGLSDKPQRWRYTLEAHVGNVERLVLALDLSRITLVVHDWGGAIGMGVARRHPERIARLVILNTAAFVDERVPMRIRLCRTPWLGGFLVRRLNAFAGLAPRMALADPRKLASSARAGLLLPYDSFANRVALHAFVRDIPTSVQHPSFAELAATDGALERFQNRPACIVWGERDWCFTPHFRRVWEGRLPSAEVHPLADAGHYLLEEAPDEVEDILRGFFARHPLRASALACSS